MKQSSDSMDVSPLLLEIPAHPSTELLIKWATTKYPERSQDMMDWLFSYYFWQRWDGKEKSLREIEVMARAAASARMAALDNTNQLGNIVEESTVLQLLYAERTRWYRFEEISDIRELIQDKVIEQLAKEEIRRKKAENENKPYKPGGKVYEYQRLLSVINALENMGVPKESIIPVATNFSKAVVAAGSILNVLESTAGTETDRLATVNEILRDVADTSVTVDTFELKNRERFGKIKNLPPPVTGSIVLTAGGKELIIIESDRSHSSAIQGALRGLVRDLSIEDGAYLLKRLSQLVLPDRSHKVERYHLHNNGNGPVLEPGNGLALPSVEEMENIILLEVAKNLFYIKQLIRANQEAWVLLYEIASQVPREAVDELAESAFLYSGEGMHDLIRVAVMRNYTVPENLGVVLEYSSVIETCWQESTQVYGIFLRVFPERVYQDI